MRRAFRLSSVYVSSILSNSNIDATFSSQFFKFWDICFWIRVEKFNQKGNKIESHKYYKVHAAVYENENVDKITNFLL